MVKKERINILKKSDDCGGSVIYWMSRDQRVDDNWAMLFAQEIAESNQQPLAVVFCLADDFPGATFRHYDFMLKGLEEVDASLKLLNIPFYLLKGNPPESLKTFINEYGIRHVITDFDPLYIKRKWKNDLLSIIDVNVYEVDAHNIVPCRISSEKCEFGAYTIRPKIKRLLPSFVDEFPALKKQKSSGNFSIQSTNWNTSLIIPSADKSVPSVEWQKPGSAAAKKVMSKFMNEKLGVYNSLRNDPNQDATSNLSPYFHFGQISTQRVALEILKHFPGNENTESFLEEMIIRRELSDNFCFYNNSYDSFEGFPDWAKKTLNEHRKDKREYIYDFESFERSKTHDPLWNAAQMEMVKSGKMHGYMRMYWAKKILEWTRSPEEAMEFSIRLNDRYQLDGRDPNGYVGCAWSIGGVHDRAWTERPVYGKIRYMNFNGCRRKFDVNKYISKWLGGNNSLSLY